MINAKKAFLCGYLMCTLLFMLQERDDYALELALGDE